MDKHMYGDVVLKLFSCYRDITTAEIDRADLALLVVLVSRSRHRRLYAYSQC